MEHRESVGMYISYIYRSAQSYISKELEDYAIGSGQYIYLLALYRKDGITQDTLAAKIKLDKTTVARSIKKLEEAGYIIRKRCMSDKRAFEIYLTEKGWKLQPVLYKILNQLMAIQLKDFSESEKETLLILVKKIFLNIS